MKTAFAFAMCLGLLPTALAQSPARDTPPPVIENARRERELRASVTAGTATKDTYMELARLASLQGRIDDTVEALTAAAAFEPSSVDLPHRIAVFYWDYVRRGNDTLDSGTKLAYILKGIAAEDQVLAIQPNHLEALTYKNMLLRLQANLTSDPSEQKRLIDEADALRNRVIEVQRGRQGTPSVKATDGPPPPPFPGFSERFDQAVARLQPVRVGGNIRAPAKVKDVKPVYPADAQSARVQGVVIIEAIIDEEGSVANARILRSIPMLDLAALEAVSQWKFTPTQLNGVPIGVFMTVTVNFTLME
jgi:protein TonB